MTLSKSKFCRGVQCPKMLWLEKNMPEQYDDSQQNTALLDEGNETGDLAMGYFGDYVEIAYDPTNYAGMLAETKRYIEANTPVICEAFISTGNELCAVDILRVFDAHVEIVEVKSSTKCKDIYLWDMAYQYYVLTKCGYQVRRVSLMHIAGDYIRHGELDLRQLFILEDHTDKVLAMQNDIKAIMESITKITEQPEEPDIGIGPHCDSPYDCGFKQWCWRHIPENSVFDIRGLGFSKKKKWDCYNKNIITFEALLNNHVALPEKPLQQVEWEVYNRPSYIDKAKIQAFLDELSYPLYHLDFETYMPAVPPFDRTMPYGQIPFQYSLHIEKAAGLDPEHREFLAGGYSDPRRALAESLCDDVPGDVCCLAYNMSFERSRLKELAGLFPDLANHLMAIHDNMRDLMTPFKNRDYYDRRFKGSYSIKVVQPTLCENDPELDYHALDLIHHGSEAMEAYPKLSRLPPDEAERYRKALLAYCKVDTMGMVRVLQKLRELV